MDCYWAFEPCWMFKQYIYTSKVLAGSLCVFILPSVSWNIRLPICCRDRRHHFFLPRGISTFIVAFLHHERVQSDIKSVKSSTLWTSYRTLIRRDSMEQVEKQEGQVLFIYYRSFRKAEIKGAGSVGTLSHPSLDIVLPALSFITPTGNNKSNLFYSSIHNTARQIEEERERKEHGREVDGAFRRWETMVCSWERGRTPKQSSGLLYVWLHSGVWKSICWNRALRKTKESESASKHVNTFCFKFLCWFVFNVQLDFVVCLLSNWLLSEWSACWQGEECSSWRLRPTDRKWDRDKPEAMTVPGGVVCSRLCVCERDWLSRYVCVCVCVVPLRLATEGRMEVLLIISPEANHLRPTLKVPQTHTHASKGDAILGTWAECWGLRAGSEQPTNGSLWCFCIFLDFIFLPWQLYLKRSSEVRGSSQVWMT